MQKKTNIIWDLSGTLFKPQSAGLTTKQLADLSLILYMWSGKKEPSKLDLFAIELLKKAHPPVPSCEVIRMHTGDPVPTIICLWLCGLISSTDALRKTMQSDHSNILKSLTEEESTQVYRMLEAYFDPESLALCMRPIAASMILLEECVKNPQNTLYVLSNWDKESFNPFYMINAEQSPLRYVKQERIFISADSGYIKPQPEIYQFFLSQYQLEPGTCFFIDDQKENIAGAEKNGIESMQFKENDTSELVKHLRNLNIIT